MSLIDEKKSGGRSSLWTVPLNSYLILLYYVFVVAGFLVRGDDQQPEQERGAWHGLEHGRSAHLHRLRGRGRHRRQRRRQPHLGQGDQECHPGRYTHKSCNRCLGSIFSESGSGQKYKSGFGHKSESGSGSKRLLNIAWN